MVYNRKSNISNFEKKPIDNDKVLKDGIYFCPLSGCEEIGKNFNLFGVVKNGEEQWIIVDVGTGVSRNPFGLNHHMANFNAIRNKNILGIVCTHGHDDHIGALQHLLPALGLKHVPVYSTPFTLELIKHKFNESIENNLMPKEYLKCLKKVGVGQTFSIGDFEIELIYITHSIPEPNLIRIKSKSFNYTIIHTGDWKFDSDPVIGQPTDEENLRKIGDQGVDALLCDSTNAGETNHTPPEGIVQDSLNNIIKGNGSHRIIISFFSSNVARLKTIHDLAKKYNRKLVVVGRSIIKMIKISKETGFLDSNFEYYTADSLNKNKVYGASKVNIDNSIVVCTGSQGEPGSALYRLAFPAAQRTPFHIQENDLIIFSARKIPGNELEINAIQSLFIRKKARVYIEEKDSIIHVSGHPSQPEVKKIMDLLRPTLFIPVHGDAMKFDKMLKMATEKQIPKSLMPYNGAVIDLRKGEIINSYESGTFAVDGKRIINMDSNVLYKRQEMAKNGIIFISCKKFVKTEHDILVSQYGVLEGADMINIINNLKKEITLIIKELLSSPQDQEGELFKIIRNNTQNIIFNHTGKKPTVITHCLGLTMKKPKYPQN